MVVLFVIADSMRADAPGFAGGKAKTPFLDGLAGEGSHFNDFFVSGAWTVPSLMSMFSGSLAHKIGICRWRHPFPAGRPTLLTAFQYAGFEVSCFHPYPKWGFLTIPGKGRVQSSQDIDAVVNSIKEGGDADRFFLIHHWWTHLPYMTKELSRKNWHATVDFALESLSRHPQRIAKKLEENYLKSLNHFSEEVLARYVDAAAHGGRKVLTIVTGDHGENWGASLPEGRKLEHIYDLHGRWITDENIRTPLVFHGDCANGTIPSGQKIGGMAAGVDLGPTVADLAGIPWPGPAPLKSTPGLVERNETDLKIIGRSLAPCVMDGSPAPRDEILTVSTLNTHVPQTYPLDGKEMWRTFALRNQNAWFVFDSADNTKNVSVLPDGAKPGDDVKKEVFDKLEALWRDSVDSAPIVEDEELDALRREEAQIARNLRSLGYLD